MSHSSHGILFCPKCCVFKCLFMFLLLKKNLVALWAGFFFKWIWICLAGCLITVSFHSLIIWIFIVFQLRMGSFHMHLHDVNNRPDVTCRERSCWIFAITNLTFQGCAKHMPFPTSIFIFGYFMKEFTNSHHGRLVQISETGRNKHYEY